MSKSIPINKPPFADDIALILGDSIAQEWPARVGHPVTKAVYVEGSGETEVYLQPDGAAPQTFFVATNGLPGVNLFDGLSVYYKQLKTGKHLTRLNESAQKTIYGNQPFNASPKIYIDDLYYATLQPTAPPSMRLWVTGFAYMDNGVYQYQRPLPTADFSASPDDASATAINIPSTANTAICVLVQYNKSTNALSYKQSASFPSRLSLKNRPDLIPALDDGHVFCNAFILPNGVTALTLDHIFNAPALAWFYDSSAYTFAGLADTTITGGAAGDIYYNNGSAIVNLGAGTDDQVLTLASGVPTWADAAGGGGGGGVNGGVYVTGSITTASASESGYITFSEEWDNGGYFSSGDTITVPSGKQGYYIINGVITYSSNSSSYDSLNLEIETSGGTLEVIYITTPSFVGSRSFSFTTNEISATGTIQAYYSINGDSSGSDLDIKLMAILVNSTA